MAGHRQHAKFLNSGAANEQNATLVEVSSPSNEDSPVAYKASTSPIPSNISRHHSENIEKKWKAMCDAMLKQGAWSSIRRLLNKVPKYVEEIYNRMERETSNPMEMLDEDSRRIIYKEFSRMSSSSLGELQGWEVEVLIQSEVVKKALKIQGMDLRILSSMTKEAIDKLAVSTNTSVAERSRTYDFEHFAAAAYDILRQCQRPRPSEHHAPRWHLSRYFPIDPDLPAKQSWDMFIMMLLVYCSFEVPYMLAFSTSDDALLPTTPFQAMAGNLLKKRILRPPISRRFAPLHTGTIADSRALPAL